MPITVGSSGYGGDWNTNAHGSAKWMTPEEASQLDFFAYHPSSIILGQNSSGDLACFNRQGHVLVVAPPRSGKGIGFVQANLIGYQGSMVVTDPKGENVAISFRHRKVALGHNVVVLDPTDKLASYRLAAPIPTHRFNPLAVFQNANYVEVIDDIERLADALLVTKHDEGEQHWRDGARNFLKSLLTYLVFFMPQERQNLITLSRLANGLEISQDDIFLALTYNPHPDPVMQDVIARSGAWWDKINPKERASFVSVALRSLSWLNSPVWHKHLATSDFHPYDLKAGKTTVFIVCPFDKLEDYSPWFRLVLSACTVAILRAPNRSNIPTLFMLDEYAATIGRLAILEQAASYIEGAGARYAMIFQSLGQMKELWPDPKYHTIFASAGAHVFFNATDELTSEYISSYIGKYSAMSPSAGGVSFVERFLLTPDEVRVHPENDMIAFVRGYRPAWLGKLDIRRHDAFNGRHDPNPAYFVLPEIQKSLPINSGGMLSAADAIARAKKQTQLTTANLSAAIAAKYPGKELRVQNDLIGYDEQWTNPATGQRETIFMPVMHSSLLEALGR